MRDTSKCKTMTAGEYMTPEQVAALQVSWDEAEYVLRDSAGAPEWARFIDHDGVAYSIEALAEEWLRDGVEDGELGPKELLIAISPQLVSRMIMDHIIERVEAGKLRAVVDSPDEWN